MAEWTYCEDCGNFFLANEARTDREYHFEIDGGFYENIERCPDCGSCELVDAKECEMCGEPSLSEVCDECEQELIKEFNEWVQGESKRFNNCNIETLKGIIYEWLVDN